MFQSNLVVPNLESLWTEKKKKKRNVHGLSTIRNVVLSTSKVAFQICYVQVLCCQKEQESKCNENDKGF